jgi:UPF0755 protein
MGQAFLKWFLVFIIAVILLGFGKYFYFLNAPASKSDEKIVFDVPSGTGLNIIASRLKSEGLISDIKLFKLYVYLKKGVNKFKAGEYLLSPALTPLEIYSILISGISILYDLTIPEGYNIYDIADLLQNSGLGDREEFLRLVKDKDVIRDFDLEGRSLEGYLFPSTYKFTKSATSMKIIKTMINKFNSIFTDEMERKATEIGFSRHQVVILASMVEKETGYAKEREIIASVFHNRLNKIMRLESDPTVIYGIENFDGNLTRADLRKWSPYNTYRIFGLPEGPIANPGLESLKAVLWPAETDYLFFVSRNDGTHKFTTNYEDHKKAVNLYQRTRKNRQGKSWRDLHKKKER